MATWHIFPHFADIQVLLHRNFKVSISREVGLKFRNCASPIHTAEMGYMDTSQKISEPQEYNNGH